MQVCVMQGDAGEDQGARPHDPVHGLVRPDACHAGIEVGSNDGDRVGQDGCIVGDARGASSLRTLPSRRGGKVIDKINAIESVNARLRKIIRTRGHLPTGKAAARLIYLALRNIKSEWRRAAHEWKTAINQYAIL